MNARIAGKWTVVADGSVQDRPWYAFRWDDPIDRDGQDFATWREAFFYASMMAGLDRKATRVRELSTIKIGHLCGPACNQSHWELKA